jgi:hypothetical protein
LSICYGKAVKASPFHEDTPWTIEEGIRKKRGTGSCARCSSETMALKLDPVLVSADRAVALSEEQLLVGQSVFSAEAGARFPLSARNGLGLYG